MLYLFLLSLFAVFTTSIDAYANGGACSALQTMVPGHGKNTANGSPPYSVRALSNSVQAGQTLTVEITATRDLSGLALQGRDKNDNRIGEFPLSGNEASTYCVHYHCDDRGALTHSKKRCPTRSGCTVANPCKIDLTWKAPASGADSVHFLLTGVLEYQSWWVQIPSDSVTIEP